MVFQEYVDAIRVAQARTAGLEAQMHHALESWPLRPTVEALMGSLRGVATITATAMTVLAELGDLTRFDSPRQLVGSLGLAPALGDDHKDRQRLRPSGPGRIGKRLPLPDQ